VESKVDYNLFTEQRPPLAGFRSLVLFGVLPANLSRPKFTFTFWRSVWNSAHRTQNPLLCWTF